MSTTTRKTRPNANPVLALMRDYFGDGDSWGTALSFTYAVCDVLYDADPNAVPADLAYSPALSGPEVPTARYGDTGEPIGLDCPSETFMVWEWLHQSEDFTTEPAYWTDPTFDGRMRELVTAARCLSRYLTWLTAAGHSY